MQESHDGSSAARPPGRWIDVAADGDLADEGALETTVEGELIAIFRHDGRLFAMEGLCAHHGGPLSQGQVADGCVTCPWHGWRYHLHNGTHTSSGAQLIRSYPVRVNGGRIEIAL